MLPDPERVDTVLITVGRIGRAHGVRGAVAVTVLTDEPDRRFAPGTALICAPTSVGPLVVHEVRWHSGRLLVNFENVTDRSAAEALRGTELQCEVDPHDRPADPEEYYDHQLIGLAVRTTGGQELGTVAEISHLPAQDLLIVRDPADHEHLIPFVSAIVLSVDLQQGIVIDPPAGLIADTDAGGKATP